jgi:hypothetical protein
MHHLFTQPTSAACHSVVPRRRNIAWSAFVVAGAWLLSTVGARAAEDRLYGSVLDQAAALGALNSGPLARVTTGPVGPDACAGARSSTAADPDGEPRIYRRDLEVSELLQKLSLVASDERGCKYSRDQLTELYVKQRSTAEADWSCVLFLNNLQRDSLKDCIVDPDRLTQFRASRRHTLHGRISYLGVLPLRYAYDAWWSPELQRNVIEVRLRFKGSAAQNGAELSRMSEGLRMAAQHWNRLGRYGNFQFIFRLAMPGETAHFTPELILGQTRGPYHLKWSARWPVENIAHELGHMLGLDDEYDLVRNALELGEDSVERLRCLPGSRMCSPANAAGEVQEHHFYTVLRRIACQPGEPAPPPPPPDLRAPTDALRVAIPPPAP